jgi:hypothetical protein
MSNSVSSLDCGANRCRSNNPNLPSIPDHHDDVSTAGGAIAATDPTSKGLLAQGLHVYCFGGSFGREHSSLLSETATANLRPGCGHGVEHGARAKSGAASLQRGHQRAGGDPGERRVPRGAPALQGGGGATHLAFAGRLCIC